MKRTYKEYQEHCYSETKLYLNNDEHCYNCLAEIVNSGNPEYSLQVRTVALLEMLPDTRPDGGAWSYRAVFDEIYDHTMTKYEI